MLRSVDVFFSEKFSTFLFFRICQASSATGLVLSRALIGDISSEKDTVKMLDLLSIAMGITLALAPLAGGIINDLFKAKQIFFLSMVSMFLLFLINYVLNETNFQQTDDIFSQIKTFPIL